MAPVLVYRDVAGGAVAGPALRDSRICLICSKK
jgi:hypothetical protein